MSSYLHILLYICLLLFSAGQQQIGATEQPALIEQHVISAEPYAFDAALTSHYSAAEKAGEERYLSFSPSFRLLVNLPARAPGAFESLSGTSYLAHIFPSHHFW